MSIGAAPNLSGAMSIGDDCCYRYAQGAGPALLGPGGMVATPCDPYNCGNGYCCSDMGSGGGNGGGGGGGGSCGSGTVTEQALVGAGAPMSPLPGSPIICEQSIVWDQCNCKFVYVPNAPVNLAVGTFAPIPPANALPPTANTSTGCAPPPPVAVPVGGVTPPAVIATSSDQCAIQVYDGTLGAFVTGLPITCLQTGVTQTPAVCDEYARFYVPSGGLFTFTSPGGLGTDCVGGSPKYTFNSGSVNVHGNNSGNLVLTQV